MTEALHQLLASHGYLALVAVGFAEYAGAPVSGTPMLIVAGGLGASAGLGPVSAVVSAAVGGLVADLGWYALVRWRGDVLVNAACGLTSNPGACVLQVEDRVARLGPAYVVPSKLLPGAGNLVAAGAALAGMKPWRFAVLDGLALLVWAGMWTAVGHMFADEVHGALKLADRYRQGALLLGVGLVVAAAAWRRTRVGRHGERHG